jgi:hypothetical protein
MGKVREYAIVLVIVVVLGLLAEKKSRRLRGRRVSDSRNQPKVIDGRSVMHLL